MSFRKLVLAVGTLVIIVPWLLISCIEDQGSNSKRELNSTIEKYSYALGKNAGGELNNIDIELDQNLFVQGLDDALKGRAPLLSEAEVASALTELTQLLQEEFTLQQQELAQNNLEQGEKFLGENKTRNGVITLESGLQYLVLQEGNGPQPEPEDTVTIHYRITLIDGAEFDSTFQRNDPATLQISQLIDGLIEGLPLMKLGGRYQFFIPSQLAYGPTGASDGMIEPNVVLIYEVELLSINK